MDRNFVFPGLTTPVVFGRGRVSQVADEVRRLGRKRPLVLCTPGPGPRALALEAAGPFAGAVMQTPVVVSAAVAADLAPGADCVVSLGGGSTTGLGKAIAVRTGADQVVIPTTYAGSEMTDILGETAGGQKTIRRDPA